MKVFSHVAWVICARNLDRGGFLHPVVWDHLCPERTILLGSNRYCGKVIFTSLFIPRACWVGLVSRCFCSVCFFLCLPLFQYFNLIGRLLLFLGSFLNFPFSDVFQSEMWCEFLAAFPDHLQPLVSRAQETVLASKAEGTIRTYLAGFKVAQNRFQHLDFDGLL